MVWDIEANGLTREASRIHVIATRCLSSGERRVFREADLDQAIKYLNTARLMIGHNTIMYDKPVLERITNTKLSPPQHDTLVASRLLYPDRGEHPAGGHSLAAWGKHLGVLKGDFGETTDWQAWSQEMEDYCVQDVEVQSKLFVHLWDLICSKSMQEACTLEHQSAEAIQGQIQFGIGFDEGRAYNLFRKLQEKHESVKHNLQQVFPPLTEERISEKTGRRLKDKVTVFNPGSRQQIAQRFISKYGWEPKQHTDSGQPKVDESILRELKYPEADLMVEYLLLEKRLGQISQWLEYSDSGRIHGDVNTNGTVTGRMSHSKPNLAQVPGVRSPYGKDCRVLFGPPKGYKHQVGIDASGLELRMLAHYMAMWDNGDYAEVVLNGDIHSHNQNAAGLETRDQAKVMIYALIYGAGDKKLGQDILNSSIHAGRRLRSKIMKGLPALKELMNSSKKVASSRGWLRGLDGRVLPVRSEHKALNVLLQSAGAVVMKKALVILSGKLQGLNAHFMANIHDEWQIATNEDPELIGRMGVEAIQEAGTHFKLNIPLDGEYQIGTDWADCH